MATKLDSRVCVSFSKPYIIRQLQCIILYGTCILQLVMDNPTKTSTVVDAKHQSSKGGAKLFMNL